ncbi:TauD/TfdA family dioxygenase [Candidatus Aalborgicola defluviihabitans]|uniref:TauD/TfdA family dioxygenase n=2 Tax=Candidatus Aalborgicola defluviihabitans TaxID=3386187 RepID=UPI001DFF6D8C|nr:TauD/TfdA family dioxygenase [Burkholderiales bacterium]MBK7279244.1 TauD/TfdA family dioxygenase [Burkholderiales bacterium]
MDNPFDLDNHAPYQRWRDTKRASHPGRAEDLIVDVADPRALSQTERDRLLALCATANMAIYRSPVVAQDKAIPRLLAAQMGLHRLDGNWLADEDGISPITVSQALPPTALRTGPPGGELPAWGGPAPVGAGDRTAFIPYTNRAIKWHTDGYYHPESRQIRAMVLHCVRKAQTGGQSAVMDHEMAYIALREANPDWVRALMQPDAMTIPERLDEEGVARAEQTGPVFSVDSATGALHMRYTARTHSIVWKNDAPTLAAVAFLEQLLASDNHHVFRLTLQPGMGLVCNNVLHDRSGFVDDPAQPRLLYRARYLDRVGDMQKL